jgi:AcrR family transcriptional regulator
MPDRAKVTSLEALEAFRASLIVYLTRANRALDEVSDEVMRTRLWVQTDRREHWEGEMRRRAKVFEEKQAEFFSARMSPLQEATQAEQFAALKARRALDEAEARLSVIKKWSRQYESRVEPLAKEVDRLRDFLAAHMGRAVQYLSETIRTLADYAELAPPESSTTKPPPGAVAGANETPLPAPNKPVP